MIKAIHFKPFIVVLLIFACKDKPPVVGIQKVTSDINPSGIYRYDSIANENSTYFGEIRIKKFKGNKYLMTFFICKGEPSYNSGSFIDTLEYSRNMFKYTTVDDTSCLTTFNICDSGLVVNEKTENYNFGCGFGHAVVAHGFFRRTSNDLPKLY